MLESSADEVYAFLDTSARAIIVEDGTEQDYISVFQSICDCLALKSLKSDRRKKELIFKAKGTITRRKKSKTPRKQAHRKNGRIVSIAYTSSESETDVDIETLDNAATTINSVARGHLDRVYTSIVELEMIFSDAATTINACVRGYLTRKHFDDIYQTFLLEHDLKGEETKDSTVTLTDKNAMKNYEDGEDHFLWQIIQDESATAIQSIARGMLARQRVNAIVMKKRVLKGQEITTTIWNEDKTYCAMFSDSNFAICNSNFEEEFNLADMHGVQSLPITEKSWIANDTLTLRRDMESEFFVIQKQDGKWKKQ